MSGHEQALFTDFAPLALVTDTSGSVRRFLRELNDAKRKLIDEMSTATVGIDMAEITFADDAHVVQDFEQVRNIVPQDYGAGGSTNGSAGISLALDRLEDRKRYYKTSGIPYKQPIMVVASDGAFNVETQPDYRDRVVREVNDGRLVVVPLAFAGLAAYPHLEAISPNCKPVLVNAGTLSSINFGQFFQMLSASVEAGSTEIIQDLAENQAASIEGQR